MNRTDSKTKNMTIEFDFNSPSDARDFLRGLEMDGCTVTQAALSSGKQIIFSELSDDESMQYATEIFTDWMNDNNSKLIWVPKFH